MDKNQNSGVQKLLDAKFSELFPELKTREKIAEMTTAERRQTIKAKLIEDGVKRGLSEADFNRDEIKYFTIKIDGETLGIKQTNRIGRAVDLLEQAALKYKKPEKDKSKLEKKVVQKPKENENKTRDSFNLYFTFDNKIHALIKNPKISKEDKMAILKDQIKNQLLSQGLSNEEIASSPSNINIVGTATNAMLFNSRSSGMVDCLSSFYYGYFTQRKSAKEVDAMKKQQTAALLDVLDDPLQFLDDIREAFGYKRILGKDKDGILKALKVGSGNYDLDNLDTHEYGEYSSKSSFDTDTLTTTIEFGKQLSEEFFDFLKYYYEASGIVSEHVETSEMVVEINNANNAYIYNDLNPEDLKVIDEVVNDKNSLFHTEYKFETELPNFINLNSEKHEMLGEFSSNATTGNVEYTAKYTNDFIDMYNLFAAVKDNPEKEETIILESKPISLEVDLSAMHNNWANKEIKSNLDDPSKITETKKAETTKSADYSKNSYADISGFKEAKEKAPETKSSIEISEPITSAIFTQQTDYNFNNNQTTYTADSNFTYAGFDYSNVASTITIDNFSTELKSEENKLTPNSEQVVDFETIKKQKLENDKSDKEKTAKKLSETIEEKTIELDSKITKFKDLNVDSILKEEGVPEEERQSIINKNKNKAEIKIKEKHPENNLNNIKDLGLENINIKEK